MKNSLKCKTFCGCTVFLYLIFEFLEGIELLIVSNLSHYGDSESLTIEVACVIKEVCFKECNILAVGSYSSISHTIEFYPESIDSILDDAGCEFDIGRWVAYGSTEFFAVDDYT